VLTASIQIIAFISLTAGIILDSACHGRRHAKRLVYLHAAGGREPRGSVDRLSACGTGVDLAARLAMSPCYRVG
jgi:hypothetical protein